jgi:hypothetical protein
VSGLERLYRSHDCRLRRAVRGAVRGVDSGVIEDVCQDAWLTALRDRDRIRATEDEGLYAYRNQRESPHSFLEITASNPVGGTGWLAICSSFALDVVTLTRPRHTSDARRCHRVRRESRPRQ